MNNYKAALESYNTYYELKDSVFTERKFNQIAQMQTLYGTQKKDDEIELLHQEQKIQELNLANDKYYDETLLRINERSSFERGPLDALNMFILNLPLFI